ncbi:hypothetical protein LguiA_035089 [Lonicera macranthoides]
MSMSRRPSTSLSPTNHHHSTTSHHRSPSPSPSPSPSSASTSTPPPTLLPSTTSHKPTFPAREDCWSEEATHTLISAWGDHYLNLNRGNLRQKHWQEVASAVNSLHGHTKKSRRTDIQCKNRIDTLKKKYKIEKSKSLQSNHSYTSPWPFFNGLDSLIGSSFKPSPSVSNPRRKIVPLPAVVTPIRKILPPHPSSVPVAPRSKRPAPATAPEKIDDSFFRRNFSAIAAAAAAVEAEEEESDRSGGGDGWGDSPAAVAYRELAEAIGTFGEIYERVEESKQRQVIELEKKRMEFAKDLEIQRMKLFMESQVRLEKIKRAKPISDSEADGYL